MLAPPCASTTKAVFVDPEPLSVPVDVIDKPTFDRLDAEDVVVFSNLNAVSPALTVPEFVSVSIDWESSHVKLADPFTLSVPLNHAICLSDPTKLKTGDHVMAPV